MRSHGSLRYLVVFAHPDPESFSAALCAAAVDGLRSAGHHVDVIDLYAEQFDPRLSHDERVAYESPTPMLSAQVVGYAELVRQAQGLVFVYPTWWWGLPAILKGWLDRVLVPGVSFVLDPVTNKVKPGLGQLREVVGISTYGSSRAAMRFFNDGGRRNVLRCIRVLAPPVRCRARWLGLYGVDRSTAASRTEFLAKVRTSMASR
jgi:NAD(P)H dehydrogenase (quinone)